MGLLSGLEKFGLDVSKDMKLFEEESVETKEKGTSEKKIPTEDEFLLEKTIRCKICDKQFKTKVIKSGRAKRLEPDTDLRPRFQYIDTIKYDVTSCPHCGYTAMNRYFDLIGSAQAKLVKEGISSKFTGSKEVEEATYSYDKAIERYKLSLVNTMVKRGKDSEKAYTCLKIAWLFRGKGEEIEGKTEEEKKAKAECKQQEEEFYKNAFEGFQKAISKETFPMCGMEETTMDYLLACMSYHYHKYELASKYLSSVLTSTSASRRMKDIALELKEKIIAELRGKN